MRLVAPVARHWLAIANAATALFLALPFAAPILLRGGQAEPADWIYRAYLLTCHEWPFRAYFLFGPQTTYTASELLAAGVDSIYAFRGSPEIGFKVAFCARNVAIYAAVLAGGLAYARRRGSVPSLSFNAYLVLVGPMAVDGLTQLVGWRESTWELRTVTGVLFGLANVWLLYPRLDAELRTARPGRAVRAVPA